MRDDHPTSGTGDGTTQPGSTDGGDAPGIGRRRFLGYVLAAPTLTVAARLGVEALAPAEAAAAAPALVPSLPGPAELLDLNELLTLAALPTSHLITIRLDADGTAHFALPRAEVGQGVTTSSAMIVAEELDLPLDKVKVTLADARPELLFNQLTGGSNTTYSTYTPSASPPPSPAAGFCRPPPSSSARPSPPSPPRPVPSSPRPGRCSATANSPRRPPRCPTPPSRSPSRTAPDSASSAPGSAASTPSTR